MPIICKMPSTFHTYNGQTTVNDREQPRPDVRLARIREQEDKECETPERGMAMSRRQQQQQSRRSNSSSGIRIPSSATPRRLGLPSSSLLSQLHSCSDFRWQAMASLHEVVVGHANKSRPAAVAAAADRSRGDGDDGGEIEALAVCMQQSHCHGRHHRHGWTQDIQSAATMMTREAFLNVLFTRYGARSIHEHNVKFDVLFFLFRGGGDCHGHSSGQEGREKQQQQQQHHHKQPLIWYVEFVATLLVLEKGASPQQTLVRFFRLYQCHRRQSCTVTENIERLFLTCSRNAHEEAQMKALVRDNFLPYCYRMVAVRAAGAAAPPAGAGAGASASAYASAGAGQGKVYNICNDAFHEQDFERALTANPRVLHCFKEQMEKVRLFARPRTDKGTTLVLEHQHHQQQQSPASRKNGRGSSILGNLFPRKEKKNK